MVLWVLGEVVEGYFDFVLFFISVEYVYNVVFEMYSWVFVIIVVSYSMYWFLKNISYSFGIVDSFYWVFVVNYC